MRKPKRITTELVYACGHVFHVITRPGELTAGDLQHQQFKAMLTACPDCGNRLATRQ